MKEDKEVKLLLAKVEPSLKVQDKWDMLVTTLSFGLTPYNSLIEIVLGNLQQECSNCRQQITI